APVLPVRDAQRALHHQSARHQGFGRGRRHRSAACRHQRAGRCALALRHQAHRHAGDAARDLGSDPGGTAARRGGVEFTGLPGESGDARSRGVASAAFIALLAAAPVAGALAQTEKKCELTAYTIDEDQNGINVRAAPANDARVVGVIPLRKDEDIGVSIMAESNGWFRIKSYENHSSNKETKLTGWIHGSRLGAGLMIMQGAKGSERLREEPSDRSKTLLLLMWDPGEDGKLQRLTAELPWGRSEIIDFARIKNAATAVLLACQAGWVKIRVHKYEGWVPKARLCGSAVTTCN